MSEETISCRVRDVKFYNSQNGFIIIEGFKKKKKITVLGNSHEIEIGEHIECAGKWVTSEKFGEQFKADKIVTTLPDDESDIKEYLDQGLIRGIGPSLANRIIRFYGKHFFDVLEENPNDLLKIEGIGKKKLETIVESWKERQQLPRIKNELERYGFDFAHILKLYKIYGSNTILQLKEQPYAVLNEVPVISFKEIDNFALKNGFEKDNPSRLMSGFFEILKNEEFNKNNTIIEEKAMIDASSKLLGISFEKIETYLKKFIKEDYLKEIRRKEQVYIQSFEAHQAEQYLAKKMLLMSYENHERNNIEDDISHIEEKEGFSLTEEQKEAIKMAVTNKIGVITGGPGVGKTTVLNFLLKILKQEKETIMLCAPTGRAAQKMTESTGQPASTMHRALEYNPQHNDFGKNEMSQFEVSTIVVDEVSMIDLYLMKSFLRAIKPTTRLILIGDSNQIPSIGPGAVLKDILESKKIANVKMKTIHRQAKNSKITLNAYKVNEGEFILPNNKEKRDDFYFIKTESDQETLEKIKSLVIERIPKSFNLSAKDNIQILTPVHDGVLGTKSLNVVMQDLLNPHQKNSPTMKKGAYTYRVNDNIIQIKNNYDKSIFNGDMGVIDYITVNELGAVYDDREVNYEKSEVDEISLSYAKTLHKSQGSEYNVVIIPISQQYKYILDRSLIYTGITRGKKLVLVVGGVESFKKGIKNENSRHRKTDLKNKITSDSE